jgi:hypothetical protein
VRARATEHLALLLREVALVVHEVGGRGRLEALARRHVAGDDGLDPREQLLARHREHAVLLAQARQHQREVGAMLREPRERDVLARVVHAIGVLAQVAQDVDHQLVAGLAARVEHVDFLAEHAQQAREVFVLGMPGGDGIVHGRLRSARGARARPMVRRGRGRTLDGGQGRSMPP